MNPTLTIVHKTKKTNKLYYTGDDPTSDPTMIMQMCYLQPYLTRKIPPQVRLQEEIAIKLVSQSWCFLKKRTSLGGSK